MVTLTIFSVGYDEVHPVDTTYLRALTTGTMVLGCTGMIALTGALVQVFTVFQLSRMLGLDRMKTQINRLNNRVIICGFGRIGMQLASELHIAHTSFVIIERDAEKLADAQSQDYLCINADATDESALRKAITSCWSCAVAVFPRVQSSRRQGDASGWEGRISRTHLRIESTGWYS